MSTRYVICRKSPVSNPTTKKSFYLGSVYPKGHTTSFPFVEENAQTIESLAEKITSRISSDLTFNFKEGVVTTISAPRVEEGFLYSPLESDEVVSFYHNLSAMQRAEQQI